MHVGEILTQLKDLFFINPTVYVKTALNHHRPLLEIIIVFFTYCNIINSFYYYIPDGLDGIKKFFKKEDFYNNGLVKNKNNRNKNDNRNGRRKLRKWRVLVKKTSRKAPWINVGLYFIAGVLPFLYLVKEACLLSAKILRIPFYVFVIINIIQFAIFYFL
jgi:hypothetical protein